MQDSLFHALSATTATVVTMVMVVGGVDLHQNAACKELKYVDLKLKMTKPEIRESSQAILEKLATRRQLYRAYVSKTEAPSCQPQEFVRLSALSRTADRFVSTLTPYADEQLRNLFKFCEDQINLDVLQEEACWNETNPVDSILLEQLTDSVYSIDTSYGLINSDFEKGFLQSFLMSTGLAEPDRESELEKIKSICQEYETVMAKSYVRLSQFHGYKAKFEQFNTITGNAIKKVKVCEQAKTLTSSSV